MKLGSGYLLGLLLVVLAFNQVDRLALGLLLQDIKTDLALTDTQLGLLSGLAFALFYSVMGLPIARWADRGNRVAVISVTAALWSAAVVLCGMAGNFLQLLAIRIGVAVGEAGCIPPAHGLIADTFRREERPRAMAIYMLGTPLSAVIGYFVAGWLNQYYGWRATFVMLGAPGLLLAVLVWATLKEPRTVRPTPMAADSLMEGWRVLWRNATFRHLLLAFCVICFFGFGVGKWQAAFFIRSFGMTTGEVGTWFTLVYGLTGLAGTYCGGLLASRYAANNERLQMASTAAVYAAFWVLSSLVYLVHSRYAAFALLAVGAFGHAAATGPVFATVQSVVPAHLRSVSIALIYLFANLIGLGLGPLVGGMLSDALQPRAGTESLRYALLALCPGYIWGAWHLWRASHTVLDDIQRES